MQDQLAKLAYSGQWQDVLTLLRQRPDLVNATSSGKGYTPLHQAAWHAAELPVIGALLALGADRRLVTNQGLTARDIAQARHPDRKDMQYILSPSTRSLSQLLRKLIAETSGLFSAYDGNRLICDRLIACLGETWDETDDMAVSDAASPVTRDLGARLEAALHAITGHALSPRAEVQFLPAEHFRFSAAADFVRHTLLPLLNDLAARAATIPLEPHWVVLADLFEPAPDQWGLRGDLFLWLELRQMLCHCDLSTTPERELDWNIEARLSAAIAALTGTEIGERGDIFVRRYQRGGMSSGMVNCAHWHQTIVPSLARRADWLRQSWTGLK